MVNYTQGDMFKGDYAILVNLVNCVGVMGAGVAEQFRARWPRMFDDYAAACSRGEVQPGVLHTWEAPTGELIVNLPTKRHWRDESRYDDVEAGLRALRELLKGRGRVRVALPPPGCGHGRLDWSRVRAMIDQQLGDLEARVTAFPPRARTRR